MRYKISYMTPKKGEKATDKKEQNDILATGKLDTAQVKNGEVNLLQRLRSNEVPEELLDSDRNEVEVAGEEEIVAQVSRNLDESKQCRICFEETDDEDDPFLDICKCSGSLKYIHFTCLQRWVQSKVTEKSTESICSYVWKDFNCEICKTDLPCKQNPQK